MTDPQGAATARPEAADEAVALRLLEIVYSIPDYMVGPDARDSQGLIMPYSPYDHGRYDARKALAPALASALSALRTERDSLRQENARLREGLAKLLACPAIADCDHCDPAWGDQETAEAERFARAALSAQGASHDD